MVMTGRLRDDLLAAVPALCLLSGRSTTYFGIGRAGEVATWLGDHGIVILGLEGFTTDGTAMTPLTDYVADLSNIEPGPDRARVAAQAASKVLSQWAADVEFVDFLLQSS